MSKEMGKRQQKINNAIDGMNSVHAAKGEEKSKRGKRIITSGDDTEDLQPYYIVNTTAQPANPAPPASPCNDEADAAVGLLGLRQAFGNNDFDANKTLKAKDDQPSLVNGVLAKYAEEVTKLKEKVVQFEGANNVAPSVNLKEEIGGLQADKQKRTKKLEGERKADARLREKNGRVQAENDQRSQKDKRMIAQAVLPTPPKQFQLTPMPPGVADVLRLLKEKRDLLRSHPELKPLWKSCLRQLGIEEDSEASEKPLRGDILPSNLFRVPYSIFLLSPMALHDGSTGYMIPVVVHSTGFDKHFLCWPKEDVKKKKVQSIFLADAQCRPKLYFDLYHDQRTDRLLRDPIEDLDIRVHAEGTSFHGKSAQKWVDAMKMVHGEQ